MRITDDYFQISGTIPGKFLALYLIEHAPWYQLVVELMTNIMVGLQLPPYFKAFIQTRVPLPLKIMFENLWPKKWSDMTISLKMQHWTVKCTHRCGKGLKSISSMFCKYNHRFYTRAAEPTMKNFTHGKDASSLTLFK